MTGWEIAIIAAATIAGPILAVQAQKWVERQQKDDAASCKFFTG